MSDTSKGPRNGIFLQSDTEQRPAYVPNATDEANLMAELAAKVTANASATAVETSRGSRPASEEIQVPFQYDRTTRPDTAEKLSAALSHLTTSPGAAPVPPKNRAPLPAGLEARKLSDALAIAASPGIKPVDAPLPEKTGGRVQISVSTPEGNAQWEAYVKNRRGDPTRLEDRNGNGRGGRGG